MIVFDKSIKKLGYALLVTVSFVYTEAGKAMAEGDDKSDTSSLHRAPPLSQGTETPASALPDISRLTTRKLNQNDMDAITQALSKAPVEDKEDVVYQSQ